MNTPILIGGCGSTGSTLLAALLNRHSKIFCGPELSFFNKYLIYQNYDIFKKNFSKWHKFGVLGNGFHMDAVLFRELNYFHITLSDIEKWVEVSKNIQEFVQRLVTHCLKIEKKELFVEKTPTNVYCFHQFLDNFPHGKIIHVVRDGRDVYCSLLNRKFSKFEAGSRWLYDTLSGLSARKSKSYLEIKYEDLVNTPETILKKICSFLCVEFETSMISHTNGEKKRLIHQSWKNIPTKKITNKSVGRYKYEISKSDLEYFYSLKLTNYAKELLGSKMFNTKDLLFFLNYEVEPIKKSLKFHKMFLDLYRFSTSRKKRFLNYGKTPSPLLTTFYFLP